MIIRILLTFTAAIAVLALLSITHTARHPTVSMAATLSGERWYTVRLEGDQVGYFYTQSNFDADGAWSYQSRTHVLMQAGQPLTVEKTLRFGNQAPHQLEAAQHLSRQGGSVEEKTDVSLEDGQLVATLHFDQRQAIDWQYSLAEYVGVETWLANEATVRGERLRYPVLDLSRLQKKTRTYEFTNRTPLSLQHEAPLGPTRITLDDDFAIRHIRASDLFEFERTSMEQALQPASPAYKSTYKIPLDEPLVNTSELRELRLHIDGADVELVGRQGHISNAEDASRPGLAADEFKQMLAEAMDQNGTASQQLHDLVRYVHHRLDYRADAASVSLSVALNRGFGECTEFADLFTALARTAGWRARTIIGLAYDGQPPRGFGLHAWNEVFVDGQWHSVDPTWNQTITDATHIPVDDRLLAELKFRQGGGDLSARVVSAVYAD